MRLKFLAALVFFICFTSVAKANDGSLRVGVTGQYPPFNYIDSEGQLVGFDIDIAKEICKGLEKKCEFKTLKWDGILSALLAEKIDVVIGSMAITEERAKQVHFTDPYYESGAQLFVREGAANPGSKDFLVGVTLGTTYGEFATKKFGQNAVRSYKGDVEILQDLGSKRVDAIITDRLVGLYMNKVYKANLKLHGEAMFLERIAIPVHPERTKLLKDLNREIARLRASRTYTTLLAKYFGEDGSSGKYGVSFKWSNALVLLFKALGKTVMVAFTGIGFGLLLAVLLAAGLISLPAFLRKILVIGVDFVRATPFMVQLFTLYFGLPALGVTISAWMSAVLAIAIHSSAYLSEILKTAYQSVPIGQHHAARTLGLTRRETLLHVLWPQMLPVATAPTLNTIVAMIKDSAIVSVISVHELTMQAQQLISATFRPMEFYLLTALLYFLVTYPLLLAGKKLESGFRRKGLLHG